MMPFSARSFPASAPRRAEVPSTAPYWWMRESSVTPARASIACRGGSAGEPCGAGARPGEDEETLYVILLGIRDESAFKYDRLSVAFSHGYTTVED